MLLSDAGTRREHGALLNGTDAPRLTMVAGRPHRLRLIGIVGDIPAEVLLLRGADTLQWRVVARDGADVTEERPAAEPALRRMAAGTIVDVEFVPPGPGELTLRVTNGLFGDGRTIRPEILRSWSAPITVVAPQVSTRGARR